MCLPGMFQEGVYSCGQDSIAISPQPKGLV